VAGEGGPEKAAAGGLNGACRNETFCQVQEVHKEGEGGAR